MKKISNWPGPKAKAVIDKGRKFCATSTVESDFVPSPDKRAKGAYIYDADGNRFLDFCSGVGVANCGYGNKEIEKAISDHLKKTGRIQYIHHDFYNPESVEFCELLAEEVKKSLNAGCRYKVFLSNSGTEANEAGLKLAFALRPERRKIIVFQGAFHGRTLGSLPLMGNPNYRKDFPMAYEVTRLTFPKTGCIKSIDSFKNELFNLELYGDEYNSLVIELLQGQGGIYFADAEAVALMDDFCFRHQVIFHSDDIQAGYGRTGRFLVSEHYPFLKPDIIALAKGIANGVPVGATVFKAELDWQETGRHASTYGGNALGSAAAIATLKYFKKYRLVEQAEMLGKILRPQLESLTKKYPGVVANPRGQGLMQAVDFIKEGRPDKELCRRVMEEAYRLGLILLNAGESGIRIMPPLVIREKELKQGLKLFDQAIFEALKSIAG